jgi:riboflavin kinase / FMN adenylyltransferase
VEVHIIDFHRDIYGSTLEVEPVKFLRGEMKFDSVDALVARMKTDVAEAKSIVQHTLPTDDHRQETAS